MRSLLISKIIRDIRASKGKRKGCHGLNHSLETDGYISSIVNWVSVTKPERIDSLVDYTEQLEREIEALAAENAVLKETLEHVVNPDNQPEYHDQGMGCGVEDRGYQRDGYAACYYGWESAMERVYSEVIPDATPETPATDAALAEIRAQVWIDASVEPEFKKYYVRYIAPGGPRFCIAEWFEYDPCVPSDRRVKIWLPESSRGIYGLENVTHYCELPVFEEAGQ